MNNVYETGTAITVYGLTAPPLGTYTATIDGQNSTLTSSDNVTTHQNILFFATHLDSTQAHQLLLTCEEGGLVLDDWVAYGPPGSVGFQ